MFDEVVSENTQITIAHTHRLDIRMIVRSRLYVAVLLYGSETRMLRADYIRNLSVF